MQKYEYDDTYKVLYRSTRKTPFFVNVPPMHYITYNGKGHPSGPDFQEACNSLFSLSYTLKFKVARPKGFDYKVNPMEVSWFLDKKDGTIDFTWKAMIMQPACISHTDFAGRWRSPENLEKTSAMKSYSLKRSTLDGACSASTRAIITR